MYLLKNLKFVMVYQNVFVYILVRVVVCESFDK